jgi:rod shape-determining protein MreC
MQQIVNFIIRNKSFLLFLILFSFSVLFTIQNHSYHKSKFVNSANFLSGGIYNSVNSISQYFDLKSHNLLLQEENNRLKSVVFNTDQNLDSSYTDNLKYTSTYKLTPAIIIKNNYTFSNNILLIDKGQRDSIQQDFGVITSKGILGIVDHTSNKYATVLSILNTKSEIVQLGDIPSKAILGIGDTIMTSGRSAIFPKGIPIGVIAGFKLDAAEDFHEINVTLFNDMTNIEHVHIIQNIDRLEIDNLINPDDE